METAGISRTPVIIGIPRRFGAAQIGAHSGNGVASVRGSVPMPNGRYLRRRATWPGGDEDGRLEWTAATGGSTMVDQGRIGGDGWSEIGRHAVSKSTGWPDYIAQFHRDRPGITEALLHLSCDEFGDDPYVWLTGALPREGLVLDLGCGSGPTASGRSGWVGLDLSRAELRAAQVKGRTRVVQARAGAVPVAAGSATAVIASMSLMVTDDVGLVLSEAYRLLEPGGVMAILLPARDPVSWADRLRYAALLVAVGRSAVPFPHPEVENDVLSLLAAAGFDVVADDARRFAYPTTDRSQADLLVDSLYLPGVPVARISRARVVATHWGHTTIGIPLRRVIARRASNG